MMVETLLLHALIFFTGFFSSFLGTSVGGIGLFLVPVLIFAGLPAPVAAATSRVGLFGGSVASLFEFHRQKKVDYSIAIPLLVFSGIGAYIGSRILLQSPDVLVEKLFGVFTLVVVAISLFFKDLGIKKVSKPSWWLQGIGAFILMFLSALTAFFGGGIGLLARLTLMVFFGLTFLESAGIRKVQGVIVGITSLWIYISHDLVMWEYGITLLCANVLGSYWGSVHALKKGDLWVKKVLTFILVLMALELLWGW